MSYALKIGKFTFLCKSGYDRIAFHHTADAIYEGNLNITGHAYCQYYNRTRERRTYQTAVLDALENLKKEYTPDRRDRRETWNNSELKKDIDEAYKLARENYY